ncbi:MAG: hypothetical protein KA807_12645, partial [Prolixibacteraceae bacterium]|nr:hypothetical protein [Prolixibacteraceae bacterium]
MKTNRRKNGTVDQYYSIQFTYPKRKKQQFTGKTEEEVRQKVYRYFGVSCMTFRELYEQWQTDSNLSSVEQAKARSSRYGFARYVDELGTMIAAEVTPEDILDAGKHHIESGCKTGSANTQIRNINYMYEYGIKRGFVETNPAAKVKRFRVKETQYERYYLTDRQIYEFLVAC